MILDHLDRAFLYESMHPLFPAAFAYLKAQALPFQTQRVPVQEGFDAIFDVSQGKGRFQARLEAHRKFIDIQYVAEGREEIGYRPISECIEENPYDLERDIVFFKEAPTTFLQVPAGYFALFFPHDGHAPLLGEGEISKIVLKLSARGDA
ncbi:MAG: Toxin-antitoxin biofilm protein TabA [Chlamydiales bacterium]|jgi:YhcH/YjgK/YiaL family protein|nr:Toxin-antitoxin biofilm protein TabA [Chlamydiales bacterium]